MLRAADLGALRPFPVMSPRASGRRSEAHPVLAADEVATREPVALVLAHSRALAEDVAELVQVEYDPRPALLEPRGAPVMMRWACRTGDVDGAFADAAHVIGGSYGLPRLAAAPMETRGVIAEPDPAGDGLTLWCSVQDLHRPLEQLSHILGRPAESIRLIVPDVGGAFGSKGVVAPEVAAVAAAAGRLGVPIKWAEDRLENLVGAYQGRGTEGDLELALAPDGRMLALRARLWADLGGYLLTTTAIPPHTAATLIAGCYDIPAAEVEVTGAQTHKVPTGPYRGAGRPDAAYMIEALVDDAARQTGIDLVTLRRRNLIRTFPYRTATGLEYDSGDFERCLDLALELIENARAGDVSTEIDIHTPPGNGTPPGNHTPPDTDTARRHRHRALRGARGRRLGAPPRSPSRPADASRSPRAPARTARATTSRSRRSRPTGCRSLPPRSACASETAPPHRRASAPSAAARCRRRDRRSRSPPTSSCARPPTTRRGTWALTRPR